VIIDFARAPVPCRIIDEETGRDVSDVGYVDTEAGIVRQLGPGAGADGISPEWIERRGRFRVEFDSDGAREVAEFHSRSYPRTR
jgi:hypothetical protein